MTDAATPALTPKQYRFIEEYLVDASATKAAVRAGYSERTANRAGPRLLNHPAIAAAIADKMIERSEKIGIDSDWVLQRLIEEADADMSDIYQENGALKPVHEWPKIWRQGLVAGVEHVEIKDAEGNATGDVIVKVRLSERLRRIELIGKHIRVNAFQETVNVTGVDALSDRMERAHQRLERQARSGIAEPVTIEARASVQRETMLPGGTQPVAPPVVKPALPAPVMPTPYRPAPDAAPWPPSGSRTKIEYDPFN